MDNTILKLRDRAMRSITRKDEQIREMEEKLAMVQEYIVSELEPRGPGRVVASRVADRLQDILDGEEEEDDD